MSTNPFDELAGALATLTAKVDEINAKVSAPRVEWEPISVAAKQRRKGRRALFAAIKSGRVRAKLVPTTTGGKPRHLLNTDDLDQLFPVRA